MPSKKINFLKKLKTLLGESDLLTNADDCAPFGTDWTKQVSRPLAVALPRNTEQISKILKLCSASRMAVVPSGGRTGLAGGAVASHGELVLSLQRMNRIDPVDPVGRSVTVQAGAVTQEVHEQCAAHGLTWPIDLASKGTSQIGGNLSTNAGGIRVIRYGMSRKWVTALQAVTMSGEILNLNQELEKNNTGYDLLQLLIGSEGTLAVLTQATLKLVRISENDLVLFFALTDIPSILKLFENARRGPFEIMAFEFMSAACLQAVRDKLGRRPRFSSESPFYALMEIEIESGVQARDRVDRWLSELVEKGLVADGMVAKSASERSEVWGLREGITESLAVKGPVKKYDVSVPVRRILSFLSEVQTIFDESHYRIDLYLFGHIGDGSPHLNLVKSADASLKDYERDCSKFEKKLYALLKTHSGSVSAEHGIGNLKKNWLDFSRTDEELRLYRSIKKAFDPKGLLNPGKVIDL